MSYGLISYTLCACSTSLKTPGLTPASEPVLLIINDTCASCQPSFRIAVINKHHDLARKSLLKQAGKEISVAEAEWILQNNERLRQERIMKQIQVERSLVIEDEQEGRFMDWGVRSRDVGMDWEVHPINQNK